jgi:L-ascorbate metabolism protein UlaG (beta-lactamase superfamily)
LGPIFAKKRGDFVIPEANRAFVAERLGCEIDWATGLRDGQTVDFGWLKIHGLPATHNTIERDAAGNPRCMGFVAEWAGQRIYHAGDTLFFDEMIELLRPFEVDLALLPINGNDPSRGVAGNLDGLEAARLAKAIGARLVVPCHYDLFEFNTADPSIFEAECRRLGQPFRTLRLGESISGF